MTDVDWKRSRKQVSQNHQKTEAYCHSRVETINAFNYIHTLLIGRQQPNPENPPISNRNYTNEMILKYFSLCSTFTIYLKHSFKMSTACYFHSSIAEPMTK